MKNDVIGVARKRMTSIPEHEERCGSDGEGLSYAKASHCPFDVRSAASTRSLFNNSALGEKRGRKIERRSALSRFLTIGREIF